MRLSRLRITNHQQVTDLDIEVRRHLVLVGVNDVGKTTIVRCLDALLRASMSQLHAWFGAEAFRDPARPLLVEASLVDLGEDDLAWFADEAEVVPTATGHEYRLTVRLVVTLDLADPESKSVVRELVKGEVGRPARPRQLAAIGWVYLSANRSADRELGAGRSGAVRTLLAEADLGDDAEALRAALGAYQSGLDTAKAIGELRGDIAEALGAVYPRPVVPDDVSVRLRDADGEALLGDVDIHVETPRGTVRLAEQSDGIRALSTIALHRLARRSARIVAVDEPELHLHPRSQARVGAVLASGSGQVVLATHSPAVLSGFLPSSVVAFAPDGATRQVDPARFDADWRFRQHFWLDSALEPLTARALVVVEGVSDRIMLHAAARARGVDLDRAGVCIVAVHGAGNFPNAYKLFGPSGFAITMFGLVDENEAPIITGALACSEADLVGNKVLICRADLEAECVRGLGVVRHVEALTGSGMYDVREILAGCGRAAAVDVIDPDALADWCRRDKVKVAAALAGQLTSGDAAKITVLAELVDRLVAL